MTKDVIIGIVDSKGSSGGRTNQEELWTFRFNLACWYVDSDDIKENQLTLVKKVENDELKVLMDNVKKECTIRITFNGDLSTGTVELDEIESVDFVDDNLATQLDEIRREVTYEDDELGTFILDKWVDNYCGEINWCGKKASLSLNTNDETELIEILNLYKQNIKDKENMDAKLREYASQELIELKNDYWLDDEEEEMSKETFSRLISLETLSIYPDKSYTFWFEDGDIFWGHSVVVKGDFENGFERAEMM